MANDIKTKLFVDSLSAVGLSTDYLYAVDSNIKPIINTSFPTETTTYKVTELASIEVNGITAKINNLKENDYTAFEVYPNKEPILAGTVDDVTGLTYSVDVPALTVCQFYIKTHYVADLKDQKVIVDWGDGHMTDLATAVVGEDLLSYTPIEKDNEVKIVFQHDYADSIADDKKRFIYKVYGDSVFCIRNYLSATDTHGLVCRAFEEDLPIASSVWNLASVCYGNLRLLKMDVGSNNFKTATNFGTPFTACKNLKYALGFTDAVWNSKISISQMFKECNNLEYTDFKIPYTALRQSSTDSMFHVSSFKGDIDDLFHKAYLNRIDFPCFSEAYDVRPSEMKNFTFAVDNGSIVSTSGPGFITSPYYIRKHVPKSGKGFKDYIFVDRELPELKYVSGGSSQNINCDYNTSYPVWHAFGKCHITSLGNTEHSTGLTIVGGTDVEIDDGLVTGVALDSTSTTSISITVEQLKEIIKNCNHHSVSFVIRAAKGTSKLQVSVTMNWWCAKGSGLTKEIPGYPWNLPSGTKCLYRWDSGIQWQVR